MHPLSFAERLAYREEHEAWRQTLPPSPVPDFLTGMKLRSPDSRDVPLAADPAVAQAMEVGYPDTFDNVRHVRHIYNQGAVPSCVAHTMAGMQSVHQVIEEGVLRVFDAPSVHAATGNVNEGRWPDQLLRYCQETGMPLQGGAARYKISTYAFVGYDGQWEATIKAAVSVGKVVCLAMLLPQNFGWESSGGLTQGYHEVFIIGYRPNAFLIVNSWGSGWGQEGKGWVPIPFLTGGNFQNRYVLAHSVIDVSDTGPPPPPPPNTLTVSTYDPATIRAGQPFKIFGSGFSDGLRAHWEPANREATNCPAVFVSPSQLAATMPANVQPGSGPVRVISQAGAAVGPFLTVTGTGPDPTPPPVVKDPIVTAAAKGGGLEFLQPGLTLTAAGGGFQGTLAVTKVEREANPDPGPDPDPDPDPDPGPTPVGELTVMLSIRRFINSLHITAVVRDAGTQAPVPGAVCQGTAGEAVLLPLTTHQFGYVTWPVRRVAGDVHVTATAPDGRRGEVRQSLPGWESIPELTPGEEPAGWV